MKVLIAGDFHGKFPKKIEEEAKKADLIISSGDFANSDKIRKIIFKNWVGKSWYEAVGEKKARILEKESFDSGLKVLRKINSLGKKFYFVWGNSDFYKEGKKELIPNYYEDKIRKMKNLILIDKKKKRMGEIQIIGHGGYVDVTDFIRHPVDDDREKQKEREERYNKNKKELGKLFKKGKVKDFIFLTHYTPYKIFDRIKMRGSPMYHRHAGFEPYNEVIKKYKPFLVVCGHMHEYQGVKKIGGSTIINPGAVSEGKAAVVEIEKKSIKSVRFIR
ncbi:metallophosphoesterase family protein [Candidatus Pacearchaeota archaeon]|nr:metallophosphoesterase family protein [Candidatus Pacearchaeota archaeon]